MRSHFSAFLRIFLSNVNTRARVIYATYYRNATYMQHICRIYAAYFSAYFAKFRIFFPHNLHQNGPHILRKISAKTGIPIQLNRSSHLEQFTNYRSNSTVFRHLPTTPEDSSVLQQHCHRLAVTIRAYDSNPV